MSSLARRRRSRPAGIRRVAVSRAAWLGPGVVLFTHATAPRPSGPDPDAAAARWLAVGAAWLCAAELHPDALTRHASEPVVLRGRDHGLTLDIGELSDALTDLQTLVREQLAGSDATTRSAIVDFLAALPGTVGDHPQLAPGLRQAREMLRERQPIATADGAATAVAVTGACRVDAASVFVCGTVAAGARAITVLSPEGQRLLLPVAVDGGFAGLLTVHSPHNAGWIVTVEGEDGTALEAPALSLQTAPEATRATILDAREAAHGERAAADRAIELLQRHGRDRALPATVETFGVLAAQPALAIVLSLGRDAGLLEHHLAALAEDPAGCRAELVIALDAPADPERERWCVAQLHELYDRPLTVVMTRSPAGPALLRTVGGEAATAPRLLVLERGLLPCGAALGTLLAFADALGDDAVLAPKRVRADATLPDAGYTFAARPHGGWAPVPRLGGVHADDPAANVTEPVVAAPAAGLLVGRAAHAAAARDAWRYVADLGACLDLSLTLVQGGQRTWYVPRAVLSDLAPAPAAPVSAAAIEHDNDLLSRLRGSAIAAAVGAER